MAAAFPAGPRAFGRATKLTAHLTAEGALFVQYFDLDRTGEGAADYRLRDQPGQTARRDFRDA